MTFTDGELLAMLAARAERIDGAALRVVVFADVHATPQIRPVGRAGVAWPRGLGRLAALMAAILIFGGVALALGPFGRPGTASPGSASPSSAMPSPTDVAVSPPPYVEGSCPVTPITDLAGGDSSAPETLVSGIRWRYGLPGSWQAGVGQKVVLAPATPGGTVDATEIDAVSATVGSTATFRPPAAVHVVYPEASGPGFVFGIGLPTPGCWILTAVGPSVHSSIVIEARAAPATLADPTSQNVPTATAPPRPAATCPISSSPLRTRPGPSADWLDGATTWTLSSAVWRSGQPTSVMLVGGPIDGTVRQLVASRADAYAGQTPSFVADSPAFAATVVGQRSAPLILSLPSPGCWAVTAIGPTTTSTIVVEIVAAAQPSTAAAAPSPIDDGGIFGTSGLWAARGQLLYLSTDQGATWVQRSLVAGVGLDVTSGDVLSSVFVLDADHAWTASPGPGSTVPYSGQGPTFDHLHVVVSRTTDGAVTWQSVTIPGDWGGTQPVLAFADQQHGFLLLSGLRGGPASTVFATVDGGTTWQRVGGADRLGSIFSASDAATLWAGNEGDAGPVARPILDVSRDGGKTWADARLPGLVGDVYVNDNPVAPPVFSGPDGAVAVIAASTDTFPLVRFYRTSDGGQTWELAAQVLMGENGTDGVAVIDPLHFVVIDPVTGRLQATSDGGVTWQQATSSGLGVSNRLRFWDPLHGAAIVQLTNGPTPAAGLYLTNDGGTSWLPAVIAIAP